MQKRLEKRSERPMKVIRTQKDGKDWVIINTEGSEKKGNQWGADKGGLRVESWGQKIGGITRDAQGQTFATLKVILK